MLTESRQRLSQFVGVSVAAILCLGGIAALQTLQLRQLQNRGQAPSTEQLQQASRAEAAQLNLLEKLPTFGYDNLLADWTFLNFLQYFGDDSAREATDYSLSPEFFDIIIAHDPYFLNPYFFISTSTSIYAAQPERSVALMSKGLALLTPTLSPRSFYIWRSKGIDELLFLGEAEAAKKSFETAADWAIASGLPEGGDVAATSRQTAQFIAANPDSRLAQIGAWVMVLNTAVDDRTREIAVSRIEALGAVISQDENGGFHIQLPSEN